MKEDCYITTIKNGYKQASSYVKGLSIKKNARMSYRTELTNQIDKVLLIFDSEYCSAMEKEKAYRIV